MPVDRFSVTMDPELGKAVRDAAEAEGMTVSAWVAEAAADRVRLRLMGEALDYWEAEYGPLTDEDMVAAEKFMQDAEREVQEKMGRRGEAAA